MEKCSTNIEPGDEYITVAGEDVLISGLLGTRERSGMWLMAGGDGSLLYRIKVRQATGFARRRQIQMDKVAAAERIRRDMPPTYVSLAEMASDWK